jgi:serine/threonine-protein kinase RsbW
MPFDSHPLAHRVVIRSSLSAARQIEEQILQEAESAGYSPQCTFAIRLALEEAMVNAHRHGNRSDGSKHLTVSYEVRPSRLIIRVRDDGEGFNPEVVPDPTAPERICLPNGRGIMLMRAYLDEVSFNEEGNEVQLVKERA